jgi:lincosamide nucleotidyltransferase A/C/D/E
VLASTAGEEIDVHVINFNDAGEGVYGPVANGQSYPAGSLTGAGVVVGLKVNCLTAEYQVESHRGYLLRDRDFDDVFALAAAFRLELPPEYEARGRPGSGAGSR